MKRVSNLSIAHQDVNALVRNAQQGDSAAFEQLIAAFTASTKRICVGICYKFTGSPQEAEDIMQQVFLKLWRKLGTFQGRSAFSTWLYRMAVNEALMHFRRPDQKNAKSKISIDEAIATGKDDRSRGDKITRELAVDDHRLKGLIDRTMIQKAVEALPPGYRTIFILHDVEGFEHREIAEIVGCSIGNSKSQLHKARVKMRDILRPTPPSKRPLARARCITATVQ